MVVVSVKIIIKKYYDQTRRHQHRRQESPLSPKKAAKEAIETFLTKLSPPSTKATKLLSPVLARSIAKVADKQVVPFGNEKARQTIKGHKVINFRVGKPLKKKVW